MSILNSLRPKSSIELLQDQSSNVLNVFTSTIENLKKINSEVAAEQTAREIKKRELENQLASLEEIKIENTKVINKISKIFE